MATRTRPRIRRARRAPAASSSGRSSPATIYRTLRGVGFSTTQAIIGTAIVLAESGGNPRAVGDGGQSFGWWQIHRPAHPDISVACATDPVCSSRAAFAISSHGTNWAPWTTFRTGSYRRFLGAARTGSRSPTASPEARRTSAEQRAICSALQRGNLSDRSAVLLRARMQRLPAPHRSAVEACVAEALLAGKISERHALLFGVTESEARGIVGSIAEGLGTIASAPFGWLDDLFSKWIVPVVKIGGGGVLMLTALGGSLGVIALGREPGSAVSSAVAPARVVARVRAPERAERARIRAANRSELARVRVSEQIRPSGRRRVRISSRSEGRRRLQEEADRAAESARERSESRRRSEAPRGGERVLELRQGSGKAYRRRSA